MEILSTATQTAIKDHQCDWCKGMIEKGEEYQKDVCKQDGEVYTWKSHTSCLKLVSALQMDDGDGVSSDDFWCHVDEAFDALRPTYEQWQMPPYSRLEIVKENYKVK